MAERGFRLEQVLRHKQQQEDAQTLELARLTAEQRRSQERLETLRAHADARLSSLVAGGSRSLDPAQLEAVQGYLDSLEHRISVEVADLAEAEARVFAGRESLVGLLQEKQLLERLRDQHQRAERLEEGRRERASSDEIAARRHQRNSPGSLLTSGAGGEGL